MQRRCEVTGTTCGEARRAASRPLLSARTHLSLPPTRNHQAAFPAAWVRQSKFWPATSRVDNVFGDRVLVARMPEVAEPEPGAREAESSSL